MRASLIMRNRHNAQTTKFFEFFFDLPLDKRKSHAIMKVQKDKNEQKMLALNILTNNLKEVKDEVQVAPKGGQCYTVEREAKMRTAR